MDRKSPDIYIEDPDGDPTPNDFQPEKRLLIAMVQRAVVDYAYPEKGKPHLQYDAGAWLFSTSRTPFSLLWVCEILAHDFPDHLHRRIQVAARTKEKRPRGVIIRVDK